MKLAIFQTCKMGGWTLFSSNIQFSFSIQFNSRAPFTIQSESDRESKERAENTYINHIANGNRAKKGTSLDRCWQWTLGLSEEV